MELFWLVWVSEANHLDDLFLGVGEGAGALVSELFCRLVPIVVIKGAITCPVFILVVHSHPILLRLLCLKIQLVLKLTSFKQDLLVL